MALAHWSLCCAANTGDKPDCLRTDAERQADALDYLWVRHPKEAWVPAVVLNKRSDGSAFVEIEGQGKRWVKRSEVGPMIGNVNAALHTLTEDLVQLDEVNEPSVISLVRRRFHADRCVQFSSERQRAFAEIRQPLLKVN